MTDLDMALEETFGEVFGSPLAEEAGSRAPMDAPPLSS
jgi:hypothetical protein